MVMRIGDTLVERGEDQSSLPSGGEGKSKIPPKAGGEGACIELRYPKHEPRFMVSDLS